MTTETAQAIDRWHKTMQTSVAFIALIGAFIYAGQRSERDEQQTRALDRMASEMQKMQEQAGEGNAQIRVLNVRMGVLEERVSRIERK
jgi:hypothetical protein